MATYKETISGKCEEYAQDPKTVFIGYNTKFGSRMYGTLEGVDKSQCLETPVCENLMVGLALGMSLVGYKPVLCFERHDFLLIALDALVNHMDKLPWMSGDKFRFPVVVRAIVGSKSPLDPGPLHKQDYTSELRSMLHYTPVMEPSSVEGFDEAWRYIEHGPVVIVERRDSYLDALPQSPRLSKDQCPQCGAYIDTCLCE